MIFFLALFASVGGSRTDVYRISFSATAALGWMGGKVSYAKGKHESGAIDGPVNNSEGVA